MGNPLSFRKKNMIVKIKLLKTWLGHPAGEILLLNDWATKDLIQRKVATLAMDVKKEEEKFPFKKKRGRHKMIENSINKQEMRSL